METRYPRLLEPYLAELLKELPAIAIDGLKAIGKTDSANRMAHSIYRLDTSRDFLLLSNDMPRLETSQEPVLIDEWQKLPETWDYVRRSVDDNFAPGRFIMTGSVSAKNIDVHSGSGRIVRVHMYPLSLQERGLSSPTVRIRDILSADAFDVNVFGDSPLKLADYVDEIYLSGLPAVRRLSNRGRSVAIASFLENLLSHDFEQEGVTLRQTMALSRWLRAYAAAIATTANYTEILDAATPGESEKPAAKTTLAYREALTRLKIIDELDAWEDGQSYYSRLKKTPKHYLADPIFATHLLHIDKDTMMGLSNKRPHETYFDKEYGDILGRLFEALVFQSLRVYASVNDAKLSYFHTRNGEREIDFILTRGAETIAIEVKLSPHIADNDVRHLVWLRERMGDKLSDAMVVNAGPYAYRRKEDGVAVVPFALLGA